METRVGIEWRAVQARLAKAGRYAGKIDGIPGRLTYAALLAHVAGGPVPLAEDMACTLAANAESYAVDANPDRLAAFLAQACHESSFAFLRETWRPTGAQKSCDGRMGNMTQGDGFRYRGRGIFRLIGKDAYATFGARLRLDLVNQPELAEKPDLAMLIALEFWKAHDLNRFADRQAWADITRRINGGTSGMVERTALTRRMLDMLA